MPKIEKKDLEKLYGQLVCTQKISIEDEEVFNDSKTHVLTFDLYDGYAYCENYQGNEYVMTYPKKEFVNKISKEMAQQIREFNALNDTDPITVSDIMSTYGILKRI